MPRLGPGDEIRSAADLGYHHYADAYTFTPGMQFPAPPKYNVERLYLSKHYGSARGYASRFTHPDFRPEPGDVYEVEVTGPVEDDPDFRAAGVYAASADPAVVIRVVERGVSMTRREQNQACWPYRYYANWDPVHAEDGTVLASAQMRANGVTNDYLALLPKWMDVSEFGPRGTLRDLTVPQLPGIEDTPATAEQVLDILGHVPIDRGPHVIAAVDDMRRAPLHCTFCGIEFGEAGMISMQEQFEACLHQTGDELIDICQFNCNQTLEPFVEALRRRNPGRWEWISPIED
ncbi:hypothetical protein [Mycobacteroides abscessus]|uniref:hypothetical protein n=1 Tax=Mycobacteroides abscessus TaxID=36809 RepID=UPI0009A64221|nr:hypothetical protein [Mycobacteroides abscessus]MBN7314137.1 hypothetical protein [Mycobacteroides abscessus subsp. abscessus]